MLQKLKSRKLWITVLAGAVVTISQSLGLDSDFTQQIVNLAVGYVIGEGAVDAARLFKSPPPQ